MITDETNGRCYVLRFEGREKDEETVNESISSTLSGQAAGEYVSGLTESYEVTDVAGELDYLVIQAKEEAEQPPESDTAETENADETGEDAQTDSVESSAE